jgi:Permeases of the major facilitator superfamily
MYDFASSAYSTNVNSFILSAFFVKAIASNTILGTSLWGYATAFAAFLVAIIGPIYGHNIDHSPNAKRNFVGLNLLTIMSIALWWFVHPGTSGTLLALALCLVSNFCYELGWILYNAMGKCLNPESHMGRFSAWGYAFGYLGGTFCLVLVLFILVQNHLNNELG